MNSDDLVKTLLGAVSGNASNTQTGSGSALTTAMNLLGSLGGSNAQGGTTAPGNLLNAALAVLGDKNAGGISGLMNSFKSSGLENVIASWISTGKNMPISADQITQVFGAAKLQQLAGQTGITTTGISAMLAQFLPTIIDQLTPDGNLPDDAAVQNALGQMQQQLAANA